jgi:hypothetical protein
VLHTEDFHKAVVVRLNEQYLMRLVFGGRSPGPPECTWYLAIKQFPKTSYDGIVQRSGAFLVPVEKERKSPRNSEHNQLTNVNCNLAHDSYESCLQNISHAYPDNLSKEESSFSFTEIPYFCAVFKQ